MDGPDAELLAAYGRERSDDAFAALVRRYIDMVYAAARRQLADPATAGDVTQAVFIILARRARTIREGRLPAWLLQVTRYCALDARRTAARRRRHEQGAAAMASAPTDSSPELDRIAAHLDDAIAQLSAPDRTAIIRHYFRQETLATVGSALGVSEDAAKKRVARAVGKLRNIFARDGITLSAALLPVIAGRHAGAAPPGLAAKTCASALAPSLAASPATIAQGALKIMAISSTKTIAAAVVLAVLLIVGLLLTLSQVSWTRPEPPIAATPSLTPASPPALTPATPALTPTPAADPPPPAADPSPIAAIRAMSEAWAANTPRPYARLHPPGTPDELAYVTAVDAIMAAQKHLLAAWQARLNPAGARPFPPDSLYIKAISTQQLADTRILSADERHAQVLVPGLLVYHMVRDQDAWKIEVTATVAEHFPADPAAATRLLTAMFRQIAAAYEDTARDIETGALTDPDLAEATIQDRLSKARTAFESRLSPLARVSP